MKLFRLEAGGEIANCATPATLSDLKAALAEHGLAAVPIEPNKSIFEAWTDYMGKATVTWDGSYKAMIKAAQEPAK